MSRNNNPLAAIVGTRGILLILAATTQPPHHYQVHSFAAKPRPKPIAKAKPIPKSITVAARTTNALLPVGIFVDLDNVAPTTLRRDDADKFIKPLTDFAQCVGILDTLYAFGNRATQTYKSQEELGYQLIDQPYVPTYDDTDTYNQDDYYEDESSAIRAPPKKSFVQTGYDEDGLLRCGICGARMKLSNKDLNKGHSMEYKLEKHMRNLHDNEQKKRKNKPTNKKGKNRFTEKERIKYHKYKAAQIGVPRGKRMLVSSSISALSPSNYNRYNNKRNTNDLFSILQEKGVKTFSAQNVDEVLQNSAFRWMDTINEKKKERKNYHKKPTEYLYFKGCLVVYSNDSDFSYLLKDAKADGYITVAVTNNENKQAARLKKACDIILKPSLSPPSSFSAGTSNTNDSDSDTLDSDVIVQDDNNVQDDNLSPLSSSLFVVEPVTDDGLLFLKEYQIRTSSRFGATGREEEPQSEEKPNIVVGTTTANVATTATTTGIKSKEESLLLPEAKHKDNTKSKREIRIKPHRVGTIEKRVKHMSDEQLYEELNYYDIPVVDDVDTTITATTADNSTTTTSKSNQRVNHEFLVAQAMREEAIPLVQVVLMEEVNTNNNNNQEQGIDYAEELFQKCLKLGLIKKKTKPWKMAIMLHNASVGRVPLPKKASEPRPRSHFVEENILYLLEQNIPIPRLWRERRTTPVIKDDIKNCVIKTKDDIEATKNENVLRGILHERGYSKLEHGTRQTLQIRLIKSVLFNTSGATTNKEIWY